MNVRYSQARRFPILAPRLIASLVSPNCPQDIQEELRQSILQLRVDSYLKTLRASTTFDQADVLDQLTMPVQLIFGSEDQLTPPSLGHDLNELLPNAQLEVLDGAGHLSNIEAPDGV